MKKIHKSNKVEQNQCLPKSFRPILWGLDWNRIDVNNDREDIVVNTLNEGTADQWRWIRKTYGDAKIRTILSRRLTTEFHPESINLARIVFGIKSMRNARRNSHSKSS